jgi:ATP-dependent Clp protease ATP-binding subunit ClpX
MPVLTYLLPLDRDALYKILTEPKNAIVKQYIRLFDMDGTKLEFENSVLDYIVDKAIEFKLGARGLRSIFETIMVDAMYESPSRNSKEMLISLQYAKERIEKLTAKLSVA